MIVDSKHGCIVDLRFRQLNVRSIFATKSRTRLRLGRIAIGVKRRGVYVRTELTTEEMPMLLPGVSSVYFTQAECAILHDDLQ